MKFVYLIIVFSILFSCKSNHKASNPSRQISPDINCPEGGNCTFEVLENSKLEILQDEFGELYPEIAVGDKLVIKYHFKKINAKKDLVDNNYSEYIYLEIDKNDEQLILKNEELQKVKMLYGRICFCRNSMGYFRIKEGQLFLFNKNKKLTINLNFKGNKVPQLTKVINENIDY